MARIPTFDGVFDTCANLWDMSLGPGVADLTPAPSSIIDEGPQRTVHRYRPTTRARRHAPVLLVPPLAAPARCFDLRRGASLVQHLVALGYPTYLVDYGPISFSDRQLGLEHWVDDVIPNAVEAVSDDANGLPVQLVGWCLGGIMSLLAVAGKDMPVRSISLVASPFDFAKVRTMAPIRRLAEVTGGRLVTGLYSALGGAPAPLVSLGFQLTALDKRITKPLTLLRNLDNRDVLAPVEAVVAVEGLLTGAPEVRVEREPGGHLGVLTGRGARNHTWRHLDEFLGAHDVAPAVVEQAAASRPREHVAA